MNESHETSPGHESQNGSEAQSGAASGSCGSSSGGCGSSSSSPQAEISFVAPIEAHAAPVTAEAAPVCSSSLHPAETGAVPAPVTAELPAAPAPVALAPVALAPVATAPVASAEVAPAPVATATATAVAEPPAAKAPTLTDAAAHDIAAALATAQRARSRAKSNARGPRPSDLIEKKIVIRRDRWDALVQLTETLKSERAVKAEPSEVAAIVLEAGLGAIIEESRAKQDRPVAAPVAKAKPAPKASAAAKVSSKVRGKLRAKGKLRPIKPTRAAPAKPRSFKHDELDVMKKLVRGLGSDRAVQRTLALWLGAHPVKGGLAVPIEDLRSLCREFKVYDTANFAQNMKKDSAFFVEVRDRSGDRLGYSLTPAGVTACQGLFTGSGK